MKKVVQVEQVKQPRSDPLTLPTNFHTRARDPNMTEPTFPDTAPPKLEQPTTPPASDPSPGIQRGAQVRFRAPEAASEVYTVSARLGATCGLLDGRGRVILNVPVASLVPCEPLPIRGVDEFQ